MMTFPVSLTDAVTRITDVICAILASKEWELHSGSLSALDYGEVRDLFRRFFDAYEGCGGEDWLGVMEWATIEELHLCGSTFSADPVTVSAIASRMEHHPNVRLER